MICSRRWPHGRDDSQQFLLLFLRVQQFTRHWQQLSVLQSVRGGGHITAIMFDAPVATVPPELEVHQDLIRKVQAFSKHAACSAPSPPAGSAVSEAVLARMLPRTMAMTSTPATHLYGERRSVAGQARSFVGRYRSVSTDPNRKG